MNFASKKDIDELDPEKTPFAFDSAKFRLLTSKEEQLERQMKRLESLRKARAKEEAFKDSVMTKIRIGEERTKDLFRRRATIIQEKARIKEVTRRERAKLRATLFEIQERNRVALKDRLQARDATVSAGTESSPSNAKRGSEPWLPALRSTSMRRTGMRSLILKRRELHQDGWEKEEYENVDEDEDGEAEGQGAERQEEEEEDDNDDDEEGEEEENSNDEAARAHVSFRNVQRFDAETGEPLFPVRGSNPPSARSKGQIKRALTLAPVARRQKQSRARKRTRRKRRSHAAGMGSGAENAGMLAPYAQKQTLPRERAKGKSKKGKISHRTGNVSDAVPGSRSKITALYWGDEEEEQVSPGKQEGVSSDSYIGGLGAEVDGATASVAALANREQVDTISEQALRATMYREIEELRKRHAAQLLKLLDAEKTKEIEREAKELIAQESGDHERIRSLRVHFRRERAASRKKLNIIRREFESELVVKLTRVGLLR